MCPLNKNGKGAAPIVRVPGGPGIELSNISDLKWSGGVTVFVALCRWGLRRLQRHGKRSVDARSQHNSGPLLWKLEPALIKSQLSAWSNLTQIDLKVRTIFFSFIHFSTATLVLFSHHLSAFQCNPFIGWGEGLEVVGENGNVWPFMYFSLIHHLLPLNFWMAEKEFLGDRREGLRCGQNVMLGINQAFFSTCFCRHTCQDSSINWI